MKTTTQTEVVKKTLTTSSKGARFTAFDLLSQIGVATGNWDVPEANIRRIIHTLRDDGMAISTRTRAGYTTYEMVR